MYRPGNEQYDYHVETYGPPEKFGYKDFIPMFTAEHFDGFSMWDSAVNEWNAANWWFFNHNNPYDTTDPRYTGLYGEPHDTNKSIDEIHATGPGWRGRTRRFWTNGSPRRRRSSTATSPSC